jgi:MFS family permease
MKPSETAQPGAARDPSDVAGAPGPDRAWLTRGVLGIVLATFFSDAGHEMVTAVLPLYLTTIGLGPGALGVMEGAADFAYSLSKLAGGVLGQRIERKRDVTAMGYGLTAVCTSAIALVTTAPAIGALRIAGAVLGPLIALLLLALGLPLAVVIAASFVPSLLAALSILVFNHDRVREDTAAARTQSKLASLPRKFWLLVSGVLLFGLGDFSRTFLIFLVAAALGTGGAGHGTLTGGVLAYAAHNLISGFAAFPAGRLGDRIAKWKVLALGYALGVLTNLLLAGATNNIYALTLAVLGSGVYIAIEDTVEKATVAEQLPRHQRSLGFGILAAANAVGDMLSSLYVGALLANGKGPLAFAIAAACGAAGALWIVMVSRGESEKA